MLFGRRRAGRWVREAGAPDVRHRHGLPWDVERPQTVELHREGGILTGTYHCACGAVTDRTGAWRFRNSRRQRDPAGLRGFRMPQPVRARVVAGIAPHPGARRHPPSHSSARHE